MRFNLEMTRKYTIPFLLRIILLENNGDYTIHTEGGDRDDCCETPTVSLFDIHLLVQQILL